MKYDTIPSLKRGALDKIVRYLDFDIDVKRNIYSRLYVNIIRLNCAE